MVLGTVLEPLAIRLPFLIMLTGALAERLHESAAELAELAMPAGFAQPRDAVPASAETRF
jgi:hypothetical protein